MTDTYIRDFVGYGGNPPDPQWPGDARIAVSFVLNYEEGGENTVLNGDAGSETYLHETPGGAARMGQRDLNVETVYEYGARAGFWRILEMFRERNMHFTCYGVGLALEKNPVAARAMVEAGHEIASHGYRWIDYSTVPEDVERAHIRQAIAAIEAVCGERPVGWYTGRISANTRRLVAEEGGFLYESDAYNDDLPYWIEVAGKPQLIIPYTLDNNDMKFCVPPGFSAPSGFYEYLKDAFDVLYHEGRKAPKMMSVGLHCRLAGRPGRAAALARFLDYVQGHEKVWVARRADIARHWHKVHPFRQP